MKKHTILIVDTQQDVVNSLAGVLKEEGYYTLTASGGREALEKLKRNTVDIIISNGAMRELSTKELLGKVGRTYSHSRIILAGQEEASRKQLADDENEIYWFVASPWERNHLLFTVRNAIKYADLLSKNEALLETVSVLAAKDISLDDKLQKFLTISLEQINAERGSIMLRDKQDDLVVKAATNKKIIGEKRCLKNEESVSVWVVKNGKPLFVERCKEDSRFKPSEVDLYKTDNFLCVPIRNERNATIGVFNVTDKKEGGLFTGADEKTLSAFISRIVILIENAQLKEELEEEKSRLKRRNKDLLALEQMREDLVNMIVHDLKNPLGEIMANLDLLGYGDIGGQDRECLDTAIQGSESLLRMILNLLDVRRLEDGKLRLHYEEFNVNDVIGDAVEKHKTLIKQKEIELKMVIDENVSTWIADRSLFERVLINLLSNAIGYSHRGGEIVIASGFNEEGKQLKIEVKDNGKGIAKKFHRKIFNKFSQVDDDHSKRKNSTGLGLAFCMLAIEAHQGKIWVESEEGKGSRFIFLLPLGSTNNLS